MAEDYLLIEDVLRRIREGSMTGGPDYGPAPSFDERSQFEFRPTQDFTAGMPQFDFNRQNSPNGDLRTRSIAAPPVDYRAGQMIDLRSAPNFDIPPEAYSEAQKFTNRAGPLNLQPPIGLNALPDEYASYGQSAPNLNVPSDEYASYGQYAPNLNVPSDEYVDYNQPMPVAPAAPATPASEPRMLEIKDRKRAPMPVRRPAQPVRVPQASRPVPRPAVPAVNESRRLWAIYNQTGDPADFVRASNAMRAGREDGGQVERDAFAAAGRVLSKLRLPKAVPLEDFMRGSGNARLPSTPSLESFMGDSGQRITPATGARRMPEAAPLEDFMPNARKPRLPSTPQLDEFMPIDRAGGGKVVSKALQAARAAQIKRVEQYSDAPTRRIDDWQWRPMTDVAKELDLQKIPPHVQAFGDYMRDMTAKAGKEGLSDRDLIKAYTTTMSSIQRRAADTDKIREASGLPLVGAGPKIRPEGAWSEWLMSPAGKTYLDKATKGELDQDTVNSAFSVMRKFGLAPRQIEAMDWAAKNLPGRSQAASDLVYRAGQQASPVSEWRNFTSDVSGVGPAKSGFFASLLGRGDLPTLDARQVIVNTGMPTEASKSIMGRQFQGQKSFGAQEGVDRLAARQAALALEAPSKYDPYYQHLAHHSIWDKASNEMTTHADIIRSMQKSEGGSVDAALHYLRGGHVLSDDYPTSYMPHVGRQVMADGGAPDSDIATYERQIAERENMPEDIRSMTHRPTAPTRPVEIEGGFLSGKRRLMSAPYDVAGPISGALQTAYDLKTLPFYFTPAAPLAMASDVAEGMAAGSPTQVAMSAMGPLGRVGRGAVGAATGATAAVSPDEAQAGAIQKALNAIRAYHGSPHKFDRFDMSKIGTGEGAQAYGRGLYFAENEDVARGYRDALTPQYRDLLRYAGPDRSRNAASLLASDISDREIIDVLRDLGDSNPAKSLASGRNLLNEARASGHMYDVNINADPARLLDWDRPLREQSPFLREAVEAINSRVPSYIERIRPESTGNQIEQIARWATPDSTAKGSAAALRGAGIPGIKYLDANSRGAGEGSRNYVIFDDKLIDINRRYKQGGSVSHRALMLASRNT